MEKIIYRVEDGDTLQDIARRFNTSVSVITSDNRIFPIFPGQRLLIRRLSGIRHTVKPFETLVGIAARYKVSPEKITAVNEISRIHVGQQLIIPYE